MARPPKWRRIENLPSVSLFVPAGDAPENDSGTALKLEELEAVRLKDLEGLGQSACAEKMQVSRPTFQRILLSARKKIADSLVNGKPIRIEGGHFTRNLCHIRCAACGAQWTERFEQLNADAKRACACPGCGSRDVVCGFSCRGNAGCEACRRRGTENT